MSNGVTVSCLTLNEWIEVCKNKGLVRLLRDLFNFGQQVAAHECCFHVLPRRIEYPEVVVFLQFNLKGEINRKKNNNMQVNISKFVFLWIFLKRLKTAI